MKQKETRGRLARWGGQVTEGYSKLLTKCLDRPRLAGIVSVLLAVAAVFPVFLSPWDWYAWSAVHRACEVYINAYLITKMLAKKKHRLKKGLITTVLYKLFTGKEYKGKKKHYKKVIQ